MQAAVCPQPRGQGGAHIAFSRENVPWRPSPSAQAIAALLDQVLAHPCGRIYQGCGPSFFPDPAQALTQIRGKAFHRIGAMACHVSGPTRSHVKGRPSGVLAKVLPRFGPSFPPDLGQDLFQIQHKLFPISRQELPENSAKAFLVSDTFASKY